MRMPTSMAAGSLRASGRSHHGVTNSPCAQVCPEAWVLIVTNPVNSTVPIARKIFEAAGTYSRDRLFGVTTLDVCRANTFVAEKMDVPPENVLVPVVGGHAGATILPLLSQASHDILGKLAGDEAAVTDLVKRIQARASQLLSAAVLNIAV